MRKRLPWAALAPLAVLALSGCERGAGSSEREIVTQVEALTPAPVRSADADSDTTASDNWNCLDVQRQARELGEALPRQLDPDTRATRVTANGCDLRLEYELSTLSARDVSERGMRAMRAEVIDRLCSDHGALSVMQRGGRFTNVYTDRAQATIGLFTVAADDCGI